MSNIAGGRCPLSLIRNMLHHGTPIEILYEIGSWKRVTSIVSEIQGEPRPVDGTQYLMTSDNIACRVKPNEYIWCRVIRHPA